jgi:CRP-like cAMP-binding protein
MDIQAITEILSALSAKLVREHTQLTVASQVANTLYLIVSGRAQLEQAGESWELEPGDIFGEQALEVGRPYEQTVTARSEMRLLVLSGDDLRRLTRKYSLLRQRLLNEATW